MARTSSKKEDKKNEIDETTTKSSTTKKIEKVEPTAENNIEDLKNIFNKKYFKHIKRIENRRLGNKS